MRSGWASDHTKKDEGRNGGLAAPAVASHPKAASSVAADWRATVTGLAIGAS